MLAFTTLDVVTVCGAVSAAIVSIISAIFAGLNNHRLKTPSGARIGYVAEQTHQLATVNALRTARILEGDIKPANGHTVAASDVPLPGEPPPPA